ncbi:hypothetical protein H696_03385 [Fonticula alba]|uniref:Uncharacterized protein n=1 Tax=Fonticula alba TaxID=691883 RepID=A0A058Z6N7_FONAL|nr:hypothetical protein H696_03385 [Fonticula alba]KCV69920.1 hypothetical protein H696_03385 [Fonticula alba]|eukprot:XP_009495526.1 hypothetical protein H696_03385 [Fonticula alba]
MEGRSKESSETAVEAANAAPGSKWKSPPSAGGASSYGSKEESGDEGSGARSKDKSGGAPGPWVSGPSEPATWAGQLAGRVAAVLAGSAGGGDCPAAVCGRLRGGRAVQDSHAGGGGEAGRSSGRASATGEARAWPVACEEDRTGEQAAEGKAAGDGATPGGPVGGMSEAAELKLKRRRRAGGAGSWAGRRGRLVGASLGAGSAGARDRRKKTAVSPCREQESRPSWRRSRRVACGARPACSMAWTFDDQTTSGGLRSSSRWRSPERKVSSSAAGSGGRWPGVSRSLASAGARGSCSRHREPRCACSRAKRRSHEEASRMRGLKPRSATRAWVPRSAGIRYSWSSGGGSRSAGGREAGGPSSRVAICPNCSRL